ncbi:TPA: EpsG family protein [Vibrio vulnificus]|nr:EpsG family protein [Vibrio vulnificus]
MNRVNFNRKIAGYEYFILLFSFLYSFLLACAIPVDAVLDRVNYLTYAADSEIIITRYLSSGLSSLIFNEPIWLGLNFFLSLLFSPENTVSVIVFISSFLSSYFVLKVSPKNIVFLLFILFVPQVIGKYIVHLRQGLAISVFLMGWYITNIKLRYLIFFTTPFIHSSFFFVLILLILTEVSLKMKLARDIRSILVVCVGLALGVGLNYIVGFFGARQATEYQFTSDSVSGIGFLFWLGVLSLYWFQGHVFVRKHAFSISAIVFYLSTYFFLEVSGRIFESMIVVVLLASIDLRSWRKSTFFIALSFFVLLTWLQRVNQPMFGWGV